MAARFISVALSATVVPFKAQMVAAGSAVKQFSTEVNTAAVKNNKAVQAMATGMAAVGAAAVAMAAVSVRSAMQMETRMQNVATIWTDTGTSVAKAGQQIIEMSKTLPQSANNLAEGLYQVASSGFQGAEGMQVLQASATAASAGLTTTSTAATGITAVLNAYGMKAGEAARVSDVLFTTVNLGVVTFEELSQTLGDFVGLAATAHISIEDSAAAFATMTLNGISASESGTSLNRVIQSIIQPSEEMAAVLAAAGYESGQMAIDALGLKGVVELLGQATGGSATQMGILVPEMRGLRGMLALTSAEGANYSRVQGQMSDTAVLFGATQRALAEQSESTSFQLGILKNTIMAVAIGFGQALLPVLKPIIGLFQGLADTFSGLPGPLQTIVVGFGLLAATIVGLAGAYLLLAPRIAATITLMQGSTAAATIASAAFTALKISMGVIGLALLVVTPLMMAFARSKGEAKRQSEELKATLDQETGAITANSKAALAKMAVDSGLVEQANTYGISMEALMGAMLGEAEATAIVTARIADLKAEIAANPNPDTEGDLAHQTNLLNAFGKAVARTANDVDGQGAAVRRTHAANNAAGGAIAKMTGITEAQAQAALDDAKALQDLGAALSGIVSVSAAVSAASAAASDSGGGGGNDAVQAAITERHQIEQDALDATQKAESDALDRRNQAVSDALDARQKIETDALALSQRAVTDALDLKFRAEMDGYERDARAHKAALDDKHRAEQHAMDDRIALLDIEYDKKKKAEDRLYGVEKDRIEALIDSTFGEEREGHKASLLALEDTHDDRLNAIDQAEKTEVRALKDGLDDKQRADKQALDDTLAVIKTGITDRQAVEKTAADDAYKARTDALALIHTAEDTALGVRLKALTDNLDLQQQAVDRALTNRQNAEDTAADTRRSSGAAKAELTLADIQAQFIKLQTEADASFTALATIYTRGGGKVTEAMLVEIQKLPPKVQTELANAGAPAFDQFIESLRVSMLTKDVSQITSAAGRTGDAIGRGIGDGVFAGLAAILSAPGPYGLLPGALLLGTGDGPGRGGSALNRVNSVLGRFPGARVTSTYRTPAHNASIGGSPTSYHLDQINPAVDIAGPTNVLNSLHRQLASMGGWRELLWQVEGHYDHIHAAADGLVSRQAMLSSRPILWAEAGPEAYIPLRRTNTARSLALTAQVAGYYGHGLIPMANGGIVGGGGGGGPGGTSISIPIHVEAHVSAHADPDSVGRAIAVHTQRAVTEALDTVGRQVTSKAWRN